MPMADSIQIAQKLWNYRNILRDDDLSYGDYPSTSLRTGYAQPTLMLFPEIANEQANPPFNKPSPIPKGKDGSALLAKDCNEIEIHYRFHHRLHKAFVSTLVSTRGTT